MLLFDLICHCEFSLFGNEAIPIGVWQGSCERLLNSFKVRNDKETHMREMGNPRCGIVSLRYAPFTTRMPLSFFIVFRF